MEKKTYVNAKVCHFSHSLDSDGFEDKGSNGEGSKGTSFNNISERRQEIARLDGECQGDCQHYYVKEAGVWKCHSVMSRL